MNGLYLLIGELDEFLFINILVPGSQIDKKDFTAAVSQLSSVPETSFLVVVQNPECYADVSGIEHFTRQNENGFYFVIFYEFLTNGDCVFVSKSTVSKKKSSNTSGGIHL